MRATWSLCLLALLAGLLIGCGGGEGDDDPLVTALGGKRADAEQLDEVLRTVAPFPETQASFVGASRDGDLHGAFEAVRRMREQVRAGLRLTGELETPELRITLEDYLGAAGNYVDAAHAVIASIDPSPPPPGRVRKLIARLVAAQQALRTADQNLVARVMAAFPADQRDELRDALGDARQRQWEIIRGED